MHQPICRDRPTVLLIVFLVSLFAGTPTPGPAAPARDAEAMAILQRMADFLSRAQRLSVTAEIGFDVVQASGEKLEFGETRQFLIRRPDRMRVDITKRDGATSGFRFDGQEIAVFNTREQVYATAAKPGTLDEAIAYFINDLDMRFPLAELFSSTAGRVVSGEGPHRVQRWARTHYGHTLRAPGLAGGSERHAAMGCTRRPTAAVPTGDHLQSCRGPAAILGAVQRLESLA